MLGFAVSTRPCKSLSLPLLHRSVSLHSYAWDVPSVAQACFYPHFDPLSASRASPVASFPGCVMIRQASLIGEAITGKGTLAQLDMETGIPIYEAEPLLLFFILFSLVGSVRGLDAAGAAAFRNDGQKSQLWARLKAKSLRGFLGLPETGEALSSWGGGVVTSAADGPTS